MGDQGLFLLIVVSDDTVLDQGVSEKFLSVMAGLPVDQFVAGCQAGLIGKSAIALMAVWMEEDTPRPAFDVWPVIDFVAQIITVQFHIYTVSAFKTSLSGTVMPSNGRLAVS